MANISKAALKVESNNTYIDNNSGLITPDNIRAFNNDLIDSTVAQDDYNATSASFAEASASLPALSSSVANLNNIEFVSASQTASMVVASASYTDYAVTASYALNGGSGGGTVDTSSLVDTASFGAYTASVSNRATTGSNTFNDDNTFERNLTVLGTASINYLNANIISQSIIFSSGSNRLGDSLLDTQELTGSVGVFGTFTVYGEVDLSGSFEGDLDGTASLAVSSAYAEHAFTSVTASHVNLENDVVSYKNQTGIIEGGVLSIGAGNNKFSVSGGKAQIISQSLEGTGIKTSKTITQWSTQTDIDLDYLLTKPVTFIYIDGAGDIYQQTSSFTPADYRTKICLGSITHADNLYIDSVENDQIVAYNSYKPDEIVNIYGVSKLKGFQMYPISGTYGLTINSGSVYHNGANYANDQWNSNTREIVKVETASFTRVHQSGSEYIFDNSASLFGPDYYTALDADHYVDLNTGLLVTTSLDYFTVQRVYQHPENPTKLFAYYGPQEYQFVDDAVNAIAFEKFEESDATKYNTLFLGYVVVKQGGNTLVNPTNGVIIYSGINRSIFLSTGTNIGALQTPLTALTYCFNTPAVTWSLQHNLQVDYPIVNAYKSGSKEIVIPNTIKSIDSNMIDLYFAFPFAGCVTVAAAGAQIIQAPFQPGGLPTQSFNTWTGSTDSQFSGTASFAITASYVEGFNSVTSSYSLFALTASYVSQSITLPETYSNAYSSSVSTQATTASFAFTASHVALAKSSSYAFTASFLQGSVETASYVKLAQTASRAFTASWALEAIDSLNTIQARSASLAETASYALRAGLALGLTETQSLAWTASWVGVAQTASRVVGVNVIGTVSSSISSSFATSASYARNSLSSSFAETSSFIFVTQSNVTSASWASQSFTAVSASFATTALTASFFSGSISNAILAQTASFVQNAQFATASLSASFALTASFVNTALTASYIAGPLVIGFVSNSFSASYVQTAQTASFVTGSDVVGTVNASYTSSIAFTASYVSGAIRNYPDTDNTTAVVNTISTITSASYAALATKDANTLYVVI
jgi:hypothetical protein